MYTQVAGRWQRLLLFTILSDSRRAPRCTDPSCCTFSQARELDTPGLLFLSSEVCIKKNPSA
jgi:hypothetical protein